MTTQITNKENQNENKKRGEREGRERERQREGGRERERWDTAQFIRPVSKMHSKVAEMMRLFRVQLSLQSPYNKIVKSAH